VRIGVVVEVVADGEAADNEGDAIDVALAGQLVQGVGDLLLLAAEPEGLFEEIALCAKPRKWGAGLLRFPVGKTGQSQRAVDAETLRELGIQIDLAAVPEPRAEKGRRRPCGLQLSAARQAVGARIGRADCGISLRQERRLRVDAPDVRFRQQCLVTRLQRQIAEMIVEAKLGEVDARIDDGVGQAEAGQVIELARQGDIVIFQLGAPVAADRKHWCRAQSCRRHSRNALRHKSRSSRRRPSAPAP
jgi:hypothetical protein